MTNIVKWYRDNRDDLYKIVNVSVFGFKVIPVKIRLKLLALLSALDKVIIDLPGVFGNALHGSELRTPETKTLGEIYVQEI